jgi:hypothetical protein
MSGLGSGRILFGVVTPRSGLVRHLTNATVKTHNNNRCNTQPSTNTRARARSVSLV